MEHFNKLTPEQNEKIAILLEEMGEASQAIGKILRHGYDSRNPNDAASVSNKEALEKELGDVVFAVRLLVCSGDLSLRSMNKHMGAKSENISSYLRHIVSLPGFPIVFGEADDDT